MATSCVWLHLRQKKLSGETSNGYSSMTKILHPVFFLSWDGVLCLISRTRVDRLMIISAFFHTHFGRSLFCFVLTRNICCLPHPVIPLNPSSCFLTNLLANLKAFHPFSQKWRLGDDAPSSRHIRTWNSREQIPWLSEAPLLRSPFQEIMFPSKGISCHHMMVRANRNQSFQIHGHLYALLSLSLCQNTEGSFYEGF